MWDTIASLGANPITLVTLVILVITITVLIKKGAFSYKGHGIQIGQVRDNEREIIMKQIQHVENSTDAVKLPEDGLDYYHTKYVLATVKLLMIKAITYNHIKDDDIYIGLKQEEVLNAVLKRTDKDYFQTEGFKSMLNAWVRDLIEDLVKIRKYYS